MLEQWVGGTEDWSDLAALVVTDGFMFENSPCWVVSNWIQRGPPKRDKRQTPVIDVCHLPSVQAEPGAVSLVLSIAIAYAAQREVEQRAETELLPTRTYREAAVTPEAGDERSAVFPGRWDLRESCWSRSRNILCAEGAMVRMRSE